MSLNDRVEASEEMTVGMADLLVSKDQNVVLCTFPLGACIGVAFYDPVSKAGGMLHSMLPDSSIDPGRAATRPAMFLDSGLLRLLEQAAKLKVKKEDMQVYVAGGSEILDGATDFNLGKRNFEVLTNVLEQHGIKIYAADVGGLTSRSMFLSLATGEVRLKFSGQVKMKKLCKP